MKYYRMLANSLSSGRSSDAWGVQPLSPVLRSCSAGQARLRASCEKETRCPVPAKTGAEVGSPAQVTKGAS